MIHESRKVPKLALALAAILALAAYPGVAQTLSSTMLTAPMVGMADAQGAEFEQELQEQDQQELVEMEQAEQQEDEQEPAEIEKAEQKEIEQEQADQKEVEKNQDHNGAGDNGDHGDGGHGSDSDASHD